MGCAASQPAEEPTAAPSGSGLPPSSQTQSDTASSSLAKRSRQTTHLPEGKGEFAAAASPLFEEYLGLMENPSPANLGDITKDDALLVIDMQRDFVPHHTEDNPDGGRFGVAEGDHIILACVQLIEHFVAKGAYVAATRDYHPHDHCSFVSHGGPFPAHCVQGTPGSFFMPDIADALAAGKRKAPERVHVAFKAMHEDVDSFGGLPYFDGGHGRIGTRAKGRDHHALGSMMGCQAAPWTGSLVLKQSAIECALADDDNETPLDMDAPPDAFACVTDAHDRKLSSLHEALSKCKRVFVCGLVLDVCVVSDI